MGEEIVEEEVAGEEIRGRAVVYWLVLAELSSLLPCSVFSLSFYAIASLFRCIGAYRILYISIVDTRCENEECICKYSSNVKTECCKAHGGTSKM